MRTNEIKMGIDRKWCIVEDHFDITANRHYESLFTLGTGYISTRGSIDEGFDNDNQGMNFDRFAGVVTLEKIPTAKSKWGTYMPAVAGNHPFLRIGVVNLPFYLGLSVTADGETLNLEESKIIDYCRWLDMKTATLYRALIWLTRSGTRIGLLFRRFMDPEQKFVCVQECEIESLEGPARITLEGFVDNDVRTNGFDKFDSRKVDDIDGKIIYSDITTNLNTRVITASMMKTSRSDNTRIASLPRKIKASVSFDLKAGENASVKKVSATIADAYYPKDVLLDVAAQMIQHNMDTETEELHRRHREVWQERWSVSDIEIDAEEAEGYDSQRAIRMAVYHLLRARAEDEDRGQICPKCNTSDVYFGGCFWDMEIFILPFYLYTNPRAARTTALFRYRNLPAAIRLAQEQGYDGARYPWTSAFNGTETCPLWEFAEHQVHITADVAVGVWHYYQTSCDAELFFNYGAEIIIQTARYWTQRVDKIPGKDGCQIYGVMGPDEYKVTTNNNAYTNHLARFNLELGAKTIGLLRRNAPEKFKDLQHRIGLSEAEADQFLEVAAGIPIPIDEKRQIVWQCDGFDTEFAPLDIAGMWKDRSKPFGLFASQEKRFRSKCLKQSDTMALFMVFPQHYTNRQKRASYDYYDSITTHDSSNSICSHMIVAANVGRAQTAYENWKRSMDIDFGAIPRASAGLHGANVGGMWQEVIFGFAGLVNALKSETLTLNPCLPKEFSRLSFRLLWRKQWVRITITKTDVEFENIDKDDLTVQMFDRRYLIKGTGKLTIDYTVEE